jgi:predicted dehydrogenase
MNGPGQVTSTTRPWRAAVIGCGRIGTLLEKDPLRGHPCTHAGLFAAHPRVRIVAGCDIRSSRRARFAVDWKIPASGVYEDYREMLDATHPEMVGIATWTNSHFAITVAAARAGARIILCEKPIARSLEEADRMIEVCRDEGALLAVHHERRWVRSFRTCRKLIADGEIGEIRTIVGNVLTGEPADDWHARPSVSGGGPTLHDGTHLFDIIRYLCGPIVEIEGETEHRDPAGEAARPLGIEHTGRALLRLENGAVAFIECGGRRGYFHFELDIQGTRGRIRIGNAENRIWTVGPSPRYEGFTEIAERPFPVSDEDEYFPHIIDEIIDAYETGRPTISSGENGRAALSDVLAVYGGPRLKTGT